MQDRIAYCTQVSRRLVGRTSAWNSYVASSIVNGPFRHVFSWS